jgi:hypothetical protein
VTPREALHHITGGLVHHVIDHTTAAQNHAGRERCHEISDTARRQKRLLGGIPEMGHTFFTFCVFVLMQFCADPAGQTPSDEPVCYRL